MRSISGKIEVTNGWQTNRMFRFDYFEGRITDSAYSMSLGKEVKDSFSPVFFGRGIGEWLW